MKPNEFKYTYTCKTNRNGIKLKAAHTGIPAQLCTDHSALARMNSCLLDFFKYRCGATGNSSMKVFQTPSPALLYSLLSSPVKSSYLQLLVKIYTLAAEAQLVLKDETHNSNMWDEEFRSVEAEGPQDF